MLKQDLSYVQIVLLLYREYRRAYLAEQEVIDQLLLKCQNELLRGDHQRPVFSLSLTVSEAKIVAKGIAAQLQQLREKLAAPEVPGEQLVRLHYAQDIARLQALSLLVEHIASRPDKPAEHG